MVASEVATVAGPSGRGTRAGRRTLLVSEFFPPRVGGTPTWFYEVYGRYPAGEAVVLSDYQPGDEEFDRRSTLPILRAPMRMSDWGLLDPRAAVQYARLALAVRAAARAHRIDMLHCGKVLPEGFVGYLVSRLTRIPYCVYAHGEEIGTGRSSRQLAWLMRRAYRGAHRVIANSENTRGLLREFGVRDSRIVVFYPGVDVERFSPSRDETAAPVWPGLSGHRVLLTVGRLQRRKGHDMVIRALPAIAAKIPRVKYVVVGTGEAESTLRSLAQELNVEHLVHFAGRVRDEDLPAYYRASDVFIMPNREEAHGDIEGFGIVFLEANACGKPVIGGRSGGTGEAIVDGETGLRIDGTSVTAVAEAAIALLKDDHRAKAMGRRGRVRVAQEFDWTAVVRQTRTCGA